MLNQYLSNFIITRTLEAHVLVNEIFTRIRIATGERIIFASLFSGGGNDDYRSPKS